MIRRKKPDMSKIDEDVGPKGFDDFELRLGDMMRGERATMGKSLLDVQRELRIRAEYVDAIENCVLSAFDIPAFIPGYVRSYARYLKMDPDFVFNTFCAESGFMVAHGMSAEASGIGRSLDGDRSPLLADHDSFKLPGEPFVPVSDGLFAQIQPRAIGWTMVVVALLAGAVYGSWTVLKQFQRVQVAPIEEAPVVLTDLDPLESATRGLRQGQGAGTSLASTDSERTNTQDRLYRPQPLEIPLMTSRDASISSLDPDIVGTFAESATQGTALAAPDHPPNIDSVTDAAQRAVEQLAASEADAALRVAQTAGGPGVPKVLEDSAPVLKILAVRLSWVRVQGADGTIFYEKTMQPGDTWTAPLTEEPPTLWTGDSGAIYLEVAEKFYGPVGPRGAVTRDVPLTIVGLEEAFPAAIWGQDSDLMRYAEAQGISFESEN